MRDLSFSLFRAGIAAADPQSAVGLHIQRLDGRLRIGDDRIDGWRKIHIVAFGKAACAMASAARDAIPTGMLSGPGVIVTTYDNARPVEGFEVLAASHPLPDNNGLLAAKRVADCVKSAKENELVLVLISGGGSALLPYPAEGIELDDKIATTRLLLESGASIDQVNCVRKHLSQLKGGGLARFSAPADLHALILSDVLGDDLSAIASGPTVPDPTTFGDAIEILKDYGSWNRAPATVRAYLQQGAEGIKPETAKPGDALFAFVSQSLIGGNGVSVDAIAEQAAQQGYRTHIYSRHLSGEARRAAEQLVLFAEKLLEQGIDPATAVIAGGETTVTVTGNGLGGRNQELALAFALLAENHNLAASWVFLSGGTDGRDGPTDAAGGLVDSQTLSKIRAAGIDPETALDNNDSHTALKAANDLVITGATGTNVADLQILLLHPFSE